jgi:hypothetical protein
VRINQLKKKFNKTNTKVELKGETFDNKARIMLLPRRKVPQWRSCFYLQMIFLTFAYFGHAKCSDIMSNADAQASNQRRVPPSGSGGGTLEKRSSYAALSKAMSDTINSEFGSEY